MRICFLIAALFAFHVHLSGQSGSDEGVIHKFFNYGLRLGVDSRNSDVCEIYENDEKIDNPRIKNGVGFQGDLFYRFNFDKVFIQSDFGFSYLKEEFFFELQREIDPETQEPIYDLIYLNSGTRSLNCAVVIGYNIVKEDSYLFNFYMGPNLRYIYLKQFNKGTTSGFENKDREAYLNIVTGLSMNISHLYFDFRYEIGLPNSKRTLNFSEMDSSSDYLKNVYIKKNENILSLSMGIMF